MALMSSPDQFLCKGAVEQEGPDQEGNTSMSGQLGHRDQDPELKAHDTDFPEPGSSPEHTGEKGRTQQPESEAQESVDPDPGERQKENQNEEKDDPLAA